MIDELKTLIQRRKAGVERRLAPVCVLSSLQKKRSDFGLRYLIFDALMIGTKAQGKRMPGVGRCP